MASALSGSIRPLLVMLALVCVFMVLGSKEAEAQAYYTEVDAAIDAVGLPPIFHDIAWLESGDDPTAVNPASGACGPFQFLPSTAWDMGYSCWDLQDPYTAAYAALELYSIAGLQPWSASIGGY